MSSVPDIRRKCGASACVKAVRVEFPRFDRYLLSKCEHPEDYGVKLMPNAEARIKALEAAGAAKPEAPPLLLPPDRQRCGGVATAV